MDGMLWFDEGADLGDGRAADLRRVAYEEYFHCVDLGKQLAPVIGRYNDWLDAGAAPREREAAPPVVPDGAASTVAPTDLDATLVGLLAAARAGSTVLYRGDEVICEAHVGPGDLGTTAPFEIFLWQRHGTATLSLDGTAAPLNEGDCALVPKGAAYSVALADASSLLLSVANAYT